MAWVQDEQGNWYDDGQGTYNTGLSSLNGSGYDATGGGQYNYPTQNATQDPNLVNYGGAPANTNYYDPNQYVDYGNGATYGGVPDLSAYGSLPYSSYSTPAGGVTSGGAPAGGSGGIGGMLGSLFGSGGVSGALSGLAGAVGGSGNLGALAGGLAGYLGSKDPLTGSLTSSGTSNGTQNLSHSTNNIPDWAMPYFQQNVQNAQGLQSAGINPTFQNGINSVNSIAQSNPYQQNTQNLTNDTLSGKYLDPASNPYLAQTASAMGQQMADAYGRGTSAQTMAQFQKNGAYGGSAMQETQAANNQAFGNSLGNAMNSLFGGNYSQERGNQLNTLGQVPSLTSSLYTGANNQLAAGAQQQNLGFQGQQLMNQTLSGLQGIQTNGTQTGTNTGATTGQQNTSQSQNPYAALLGGGITGYGLGNLLAGNKPYGAA
jgi:hypothetical protein